MARQKSSHHKHHKQKHRKKKYRSSSPANSDSESSGSESNANDVGGSSNGPGGRKNEEELKAENRDAILKRSRMWQTVSSDDDSEDDDDDKGNNGKVEHRQRSRDSGKHHRSSRRDEGGSSGRRRRDSSGRRKGTSDRDSDSDVDKSTRDSNSSSDSSSEESGGDDDGSDSESEDEDESRRKKRSRGREKRHEEGVMRDQGKSRRSDELDGSGRERKRHKKSRHSSEKKQRDKKEKKKHRERSKEKKAKKKKDKKKEKSTSGVKKGATAKMMGAVDQNAFGKYGVLREADYFSKQREFEVWMTEQKKIPDTGGMAKWETKQYFREYMEDYNTATLPHEKYINLEKWEMAEFHRKKAREMKKRAAGDSQTIKEDEMDMKIKRLKAKEEFNKKYDSIIKASIKGDKRESMQSQDMLKAQMQVAYKQGDMETVKRIEKRLKPDEMEGWR